MNTKQKSLISADNRLAALPIFLVLVLNSLTVGWVFANDDFDFQVMARTGQYGLTNIKSAPSINNHGHVAFIGNLPGESLFFAKEKQLINVTPGFVGTTFSTFLQLADDGSIVARDGSGTNIKIRTWYAGAPDANDVIADPGAGPGRVCLGGRRGGQPCSSEFDCLNWDNITFSGCIGVNRSFLTVIFPAMNNHRQTVFQGVLPGFISPTNYVVSSGAWGSSQTNVGVRLDTVRPVIADNGLIVGRAGNGPASPLRLFSVGPGQPLRILRDIADNSAFEVGQTPGISDDGAVVGFYGNLIDAGLAANLGTTTGPGIFAYYTENQRLTRLAGLQNTNMLDLSPVTAFVPDNRVAVNKDGSIAFLGSNLDGQRTIFLAHAKTGTNTEPVIEEVIAVGGSISNLVGTVTELVLTDGLNDDGTVAFLATMSDGTRTIVTADEKACPNCSRCTAGECQVSAVGVDVTIGVGSAFGSGRPGRLRINAGVASAALSTPAALQPPGGGFVKIRGGGTLQQIRSRSALADINVENPFRYHIRFYTQFSGSALGPYAPSGSPFATVTVENPDGTNAQNRLKITRNGVNVGTFVFNPVTASFDLTTGFANAERTESFHETANGDTRTTTREVTGASGGGFQAAARPALSRSVNVYRTFSWGEEVVETREGIEPEVKLTRFAYYTNGPNYRQLRSVFYPDGRWEFYKEYDPVRGLSKSVAQFRNNSYVESAAWPDPLNRSSETIYAGPIETRIEYLQGRPISRRWHVDAAPGETWDVVATDPNTEAYSSPSNLITRTFTHLTSDTRGAKAGQTSRVINPDGTISLYAYFNEMIGDPANPEGPKVEANRTVTWSGAANAEFTQVTDGNISEEITELAGNLLSRREWDVASGALINSETVTARDAFGRPTRTEYLDGTYTTRSYGCCGLESQTDREGITTTYNIDNTVTLDLDGNGTPETYYGPSVTRAGISTHTLTDPLGRAFKTILQGTNGALIVQDERHYNALGELEWSKDAMGRQTTYGEIIQGGFTVRTTTFPDGSQSIQSSYQDGSPYETRGNAVQGLRYGYEMVQDNGVWVQKNIQTRLEANGTLSDEYTATYTDFAGRAYKTEYPWPDGPGPVFSRNVYNSKGQLARSTDADNVTTLYQYNSSGELEVTAVDLDGDGLIDFDGADRITRTRTVVSDASPVLGVPARITTTEVWETNGVAQSTQLQTTETSADSLYTATTQYGLTSYVVTEIDRPSQRRTVSSYSPDNSYSITVYQHGRQSSITRYDANGVRLRESTFAYDAFGRLRSETDARNGATTYTYYDDGQIHTVTTPDPDPARTGPGYDPQTTIYTYFRDPVNGIKTVTTLPDGGVVTQEFFPSGQLKKTWGVRTNPAEYTYDRAGRMATLTTWQQFNLATGTGVAGSATTRWNYSAQGLLANKRYADNKGPSYTYTAGGKLKTRLWARGVLTTYDYDSQAGDLLSTTYSDATPAVTNTYDRLGRLASVTDASGLRAVGYRHGHTATEAYGPGLFAGLTLVRDYDDLDRQSALSVTSPTGAIYHVTYGYDAGSRLNTVTSGADVAAYTYHADSGLVNTLIQSHSNVARLTTIKLYDKLGRLQSITSVPSADSPSSFAYDYNDANQRTRATLVNDEYWTYGYDALGQVTNGVKRFPNGAPIPGYSFGYQFDQIGNRLSAPRENKTDAYTNNALNQIESVNQAPWLHALGMVSNNATLTVNGRAPVRSNGYFYIQLAATSIWNTISVQARAVGQATNGTDALAEETGHLFQPTNAVSLQYDDDGNLLSDGRWSMTWDAENRVIKKEALPTVPQTAQWRLEYVLDSIGRRVLVKVSDRSSGSWQALSVRRYLANRLEMLAEFNALPDKVIRSHIWGLDLNGTRDGTGGVGGLLMLESNVSQSPATHICAFDGNGNVLALIEAARGMQSAQYEYDPFGGTLRLSGSAARLNCFRFSTKFTEEETGDLHYEFRDYRSVLGRWLSRDPIAEKADLHLYAFSKNNPVNLYDVNGLWPDENRITSPDSSVAEVRRVELWARPASLITIGSPFGVSFHSISHRANSFVLWAIAARFWPGVHTGGGNEFVYTCKYGWIDKGHFFFSAAAAHALSSEDRAWSFGLLTERLQQWSLDRVPEGSAPGEWADSAWTPEDLPSDWHGTRFGRAVLNSEPWSLFTLEAARRWEAFLKEAGAVAVNDNTSGTLIKDAKKMKEEGVRKSTYSAALAWQKSAMGAKYKAQAYRCLCDSQTDKPRVGFEW